jgi:hypothetical protein
MLALGQTPAQSATAAPSGGILNSHLGYLPILVVLAIVIIIVMVSGRRSRSTTTRSDERASPSDWKDLGR